MLVRVIILGPKTITGYLVGKRYVKFVLSYEKIPMRCGWSKMRLQIKEWQRAGLSPTFFCHGYHDTTATTVFGNGWMQVRVYSNVCFITCVTARLRWQVHLVTILHHCCRLLPPPLIHKIIMTACKFMCISDYPVPINAPISPKTHHR